MRYRKIREEERQFVERVRQMEERLFAGQLSLQKASFMRSDGREFWHFRPSHHIATGLITQEDVALLSQPGRRILSIGACPVFLERLLLELGVPAGNILVADKDPAVLQSAGPLQAMVFDMHGAWPDIGKFDRIIFPESLCVSIGDTLREKAGAQERAVDSVSPAAHPRDALEAALLTALVRKAFDRLQPGGIILANGPMSHPNVLRIMSENLRAEGSLHTLEERRFFLSMRLDHPLGTGD